MQWFYVNQQQQRIGPCDASVLIEALRHGQITMNTLTWRDGMSTWQPLSVNAAEIGVPRHMPVAAKAKTGSSAAIWVVVLLVVGVIIVGFLGILAAIAIPAYDDYTVRAKVSEAINQASAYKVSVSEYYAEQQACMTDEDAGDIAANLAPSIKNISFGSLDAGVCAFEITLADAAYANTPDAKDFI